MTITAVESREAIAVDCDAAQPWETRADVLIVAVQTGGVPAWLGAYAEALGELDAGDRLTVHRTAGAGFLASVVEIVVLRGTAPSAARRAARAIGAAHRSRTAFAVAGIAAQADEALPFVAGFAEGRYRFTRYLGDGGIAPATLAFVGVPAAAVDGLRADLASAEIVEEAVRWCRDLTNAPARDLTPVSFAEEAVREAARWGAAVQVRDETWLAEERFSGIVSVGAGSPHPPRLVEVSYRGPEAGTTPPIVLVGKGVTFDSGGLSLKKASAMMEMKSDMAGAATVLAAVCAIARMAPPGVHVTALLTLAENMPGPGALRPGDIIRHRNGLTTEVVNTDCEGRLAMSDALTWASERRPAAIVDVATLTYSTIAALGMEVTSIIGNDATLVADIRAAGDATGDPYWELPLWEPYRRLIDSPFADLRNEEIGDGAGAITAALFLREFVDGVPWAHLDTGGTAYLDEETEDLAAGATGTGVRSLIRFVLDRSHAARRAQEGETR
ncbi:Cytosol aminopeptidase PepA [Microbacterium esteraromaticum]|uniref:Probable cytosol aminopeptidase n=1 Tax=Microbacterium esteraromaticum TaxID=57043 RepID=A0A1R4K0C2_9MICO|nr:leucyl aminopeptidase family protein [Microbacterium esteraromaticum]SJN37473.1 Cytosol aminopeptidase PepA [Microbacterium esteraromaticum]